MISNSVSFFRSLWVAGLVAAVACGPEAALHEDINDEVEVTSFVQGNNNPVLTLDGDDLIQFPSFDSIEPGSGDSLTIEAWVNLSAWPTDVNVFTQFAYIVENFGRYSLSITPAGNPRFCVALNNNGLNRWQCRNATNIVLNTNTWYHVAAVFNNNNNSMSVRVGSTTDSFSDVVGDPVDAAPSGVTWWDNVYIGTYDGASYYLNGQIDDLRIWTSARTNTQVSVGRKQNLNCNLTGLGGYWKFDGASPENESCNRSTGTAVGDAHNTNLVKLLNKNCANRGIDCVCANVATDCVSNDPVICQSAKCTLAP